MLLLIEENSLYILCGLGIAVAVLFLFCIVLLVKVQGQKMRADFFMGSNRRPSHNLEMKLEKYYESTKEIEEKYSKLLDSVLDLDKAMKTNIQKVGVVRYNPFDEMGGNLCFALALLDGKDNGVVLNGIHSRTGSFTYAKPIQLGVSTYMLSDEEIQAVKMAQEQAYKPEYEKMVKVKFRPIFRKKDREAEAVMEEQLELVQLSYTDENGNGVAEASDKKGPALGDVTTEEKEQIRQEGVMADKIAVADVMNPDVLLSDKGAISSEIIDEDETEIQETPVYLERKEVEEED